MNFSICRIAGRAVAFAAVATIVTAKPLPVVAAPKATPARFPTANGTIKYRMTMGGKMPMNSNISMTWTNYGARFRQDSQIRMNAGGKQTTMNSWSFYDGKALYSLFPRVPGAPGGAVGNKTVMRMKMPENYLSQMLMGNAQVVAGRGRLAGRGTILGKPCEIRVTSFNYPTYKGQAKIWTWQKLPLRSEISMNIKMGGGMQNMKMSMVATQLNTAVKPSPSLFRLPAGYKVQEMGDFQKQMQAQMQGRNRRR